jgi:hypothetical protein
MGEKSGMAWVDLNHGLQPPDGDDPAWEVRVRCCEHRVVAALNVLGALAHSLSFRLWVLWHWW